MAFLVFEGLDGSGKSSLIAALETELNQRGLAFVRTREPGGTELSEEIRNLILRTQGQSPTPRTELLLYEASRSQHVDLVIRPAIEAKKWILCDRFTASSVAFQAGGRAIQEKDVVTLNEFATAGLCPNLTVLIDVPVEISMSRIQSRSAKTGAEVDRIELEKIDFHQRVRASFLQQAAADPQKWLVLSGELPPEELKKRLLQHLRELGWLA
jgi:dTMP kinase